MNTRCELKFYAIIADQIESEQPFYTSFTDITLLLDNCTYYCTLSEIHLTTAKDMLTASNYGYLGMYADKGLTRPIIIGENIYDLIKDKETKTLDIYVEVNRYGLHVWRFGPLQEFSIETIDDTTEPVIPHKFLKTSSNGTELEVCIFDKWLTHGDRRHFATYTTISYSEYQKTKSNFSYTLNNVDIFEAAEPYYFGEGSPTANLFCPIGEDGDKTTVDRKFQQPDSSAFIDTEHMENFTINGAAIAYIKQGTFPKLSENCLLAEHDLMEERTLTITYADVPKWVLSGELFDVNNGAEDRSSVKVPISIKLGETELASLAINNNSLNHVPTRLGIVIAGGGGGAGGYDITKCECECGDDATAVIPGGAGGGGEITLGVLNLDYPTDIRAITSNGTSYLVVDGNIISNSSGLLPENVKIIKFNFKIKGGKGGESNGGEDTRGQKKPNNGKPGSATVVTFQIIVIDENGTEYSSSETPILAAAGGSGGNAGNIEEGEVKGGAGGGGAQHPNVNVNNTTGHYYYIKSIAGGDGGSFTITNNAGVPQNMPEYGEVLYFGSNEPDVADYKLSLIRNGLSGESVGVSNKDLRIWKLRGGWSWGAGGYGDPNVDSNPFNSANNLPEAGGGGCSLKQNLKANGTAKDDNYAEGVATSEGNRSVAEPTDGASGYIGLYY